ncbi:MAG: hypothetical protein NW215_07105 [Hyphomicrobiales bacterium]|nr:hypothetical protein [Hyphomicrobiales bacterium]
MKTKYERRHLGLRPAIIIFGLAGFHGEAKAQEIGVLATYPAPTFLENLDVAPDGAIYVTNYTGRGVERIKPGEKPARFANLDAHPVSILVRKDGFLVTAHGLPFMGGPSFIGTGRLIRLDAKGAVISEKPVPEAGMLNGMTLAPNGAILIADSVNGQILSYDTEKNEVANWFSDPVLAPQTAPRFLPGANGLKIRDGVLHISSSAQSKLFRLRIAADGAAQGPLEVAVETPGADDFAFLANGDVIMTTHSASVVKLDPAGRLHILTDDPRVQGNTAVAITGAGKDRKAIILGTGGFSEGGKADAAVVSVALPE